MRNLDVFLIFLFVRLASIFIVQTYFVPDEYWQSLEIAHKIVFDYGYLTWEWVLGIRSYIYPLIIAGLYKILAVLGLDSAEAIIIGPRILQAILSAYADLRFYQWSGTKKWAVFTVASSWFLFYTSSRTLINTFEAALTSIGLSYFPWPGKGQQDNSIFIFIAAFLCVVRPTAAITWIPICVYHLLISKYNVFYLVFTRYLPIGFFVLSVSVLLDSLVHGSFIVTPYEFLKLNVLDGVSTFYGTHPWFWYLGNGFPVILGIQFIPFVLATIVVLKNREIHQNELALLGTIVFTITIFSFLPHKEFRFLLPILPIVFYISSRFLSAWSRKASNLVVWLVAGIILIGNAVPAIYLGFIHQKGTLEVMRPLREISTTHPDNTSLLFLLPCHSTPLYSHLHVNVTTRFLTCEPNLNKTDNYLDETDRFYENPNVWLRKFYPPNGTLPSHIICFDILQPTISSILSRYKLTHSIFHTNLPITSKIGRNIQIHQRIDF